MPALRNLTDVLSTLSVAALLMAWLRRWPWWASALCAAAALFSREQNLAVVLLVLLFAFRSAELDQRWILGLLAALLSWSLWLGILRLFYGEWSLLPANGNLGPPLAGMIHRWTHLADESRSFALFHVLCMAILTLQLVMAFILIWTPGDRLIRLTALAGAALAVLGGWSLYGDTWSYPRVFAWLPLGV